jgi:hypothetical protein
MEDSNSQGRQKYIIDIGRLSLCFCRFDQRESEINRHKVQTLSFDVTL